ncbi:MAG TPA: hypothetical protein VFJ43_01865, partial [Bacteroidia bacterium]|nr:hypothetical protein [Bacteroidia bacterium]
MITIVNFGSSKTPLISEMVAACGKENVVVKWDEVSETHLKKSSGILFSGSPTMFTEADHKPYIEKFSFI